MLVNRSKFFLLLIFTLALGANMHAATVAAKTCATADVQNAINSANPGDTVTVSGTCAWTSGVTVSGKGITIQGSGSGRIIAYSSSALTIGTGSKTLTVTSANASNSTLSISAGQTLTISETGTRANFMTGTVTSYGSGTLTMNIASSGGSCGSNSESNCKRWLISTPPVTVIVNNSSTTLFSLTEDTSLHTNVSGIKVAAGTGTGDAFDFNYTAGGRAILLHDCWVEQGSGDSVHSSTNRGVVWNCSFDSSPFSMAPLAFHHQAVSVTTSWTTASNMGMNDTTGESNFYFESNDFHAYLNATDIDENGRAVFRYNLFDNAGFGTHGADTGPYGQRYFEYYNNVGNFNGYTDLTTFPMNWWIFVRGGTYVVHDNTLPDLVSQDYGTKNTINMTDMNLQRNAGPNPCWGAGTSGGKDYHTPRQVGFGNVTGKGTDGLGRTNDSVTYVGDSEPAYIWANSSQPLHNISTSDYGPGNTNSCTGSTYDTSSNYIVLNRDYFNGTTAKPGYTPYTYPHPLRGTQQNPNGPPPPTPNAPKVQ